jgi:hypothetical protein
MDDDRRPVEADLTAYRNISNLPSMSRPQNRAELISVKPAELDAALEKDRMAELCERRPASHLLPQISDRKNS